MRRRLLVGLTVVAVLAVGAVALRWQRPESESRVVEAAELSVAAVLIGDDEGFAQAREPRPLRFPKDHGPHPEFRLEWWYLTGNLATAEGRRFGYQGTFFRRALSPSPTSRSSAWAANDLYMAHFALTDVAGGRFRSFERFSRAALGLAGARSEPFRVWLEDWSLAEVSRPAGIPTGPVGRGSLFAAGLQLAQGDIGLELQLVAEKPLVLHGEKGLSRKGRKPGNASYYYSFTRLATTGSVWTAGDRFAVSGESWLDREWSSSALEEGQVGWDWFALQLSDRTELMLYRLRRSDGSIDPASSGTLIAADGSTRPLRDQEVEIETLSRWRSPESGGDYPGGWRVTLPARNLELRIEPLLSDQEVRTSFTYWEGAVRVRGSRAGASIAGHGYVELTGYGGESSPKGGQSG